MEDAGVPFAANLALLEAVHGFDFHLGPHAVAIAVETLGGNFDPVPPLALVVQHPATRPNIHPAVAVKIGHERAFTRLVERGLRLELASAVSERLQPLGRTSEQIEVAVVVKVGGKQRLPAGRNRRLGPDEGAAGLVGVRLNGVASRDGQIHIAVLVEVLHG